MMRCGPADAELFTREGSQRVISLLFPASTSGPTMFAESELPLY